MPANLTGLHSGETKARHDETLDAVVRDGERSAEVILVRRGSDGAEYTLGGHKLSDGGALTDDGTVIEEAIASTVRLPVGRARDGRPLVDIVFDLPVPAAWQGHSYLRFMHPLVLDENMTGDVGGRTYRYDHQLGLIEVRS